jgi:outer membrane protein TolC
MYNFLKDDLEKLEKAINDGDKEQIDIFFSYWGQHLESLKMANGGSLPFMTDPNFGNFQNTGAFAEGGYFDKLQDVRFLFSVGEKIKVPQMGKRKLELLDANVNQLKKTLDDTKAYYDQGFVEKIDIDRLNVLYNNLITERENVSRIVDLSKVVLKFQIGMSLSSNLDLKDKLEDIVLQQLINTEEKINVDARVEYQLLKTQMRLNELDYKRNMVTRAPSLFAFGSYSQNAFNNDFGQLTDKFYPTTVVGLQLNVPIIGSGKKWYQTKQAKLTLEKSKNDLKYLESALQLESKSANVTFNNSVSSLNNQRKNMDLAAEILRVSKAKYEQGVGSSLEVVTAQTSLKEAETNYINALFNALVAKVELEKSNGNIQ